MTELATTAQTAAVSVRRVAAGVRVALGRASERWALFTSALLVGLGTSLSACGEPAGDASSSAALRAQAEPFLREFETFDAWARRNLDADLALRDERALTETVFAPIRRERHVVAAWVEREGPDPRHVALRTEVALTFDWVELRGVPMLARLEAAAAELTDPRSRPRAPEPVLILSRRVSSARGGGAVRVTVAYGLSGAASE
ncbi:MAG: hypothetical protein R3B40_16380 [Polyangiales bacterium]